MLEVNGKKKRYINEKRSGDIIPAVFCIDRILRFKHFFEKYLDYQWNFMEIFYLKKNFFSKKFCLVNL